MNKILCSTGAIIGRPNGRDHRIMKMALKSLKSDGFELMLYDTWYDKLDEIVDFILENSFDIFTIHFDKKIGELLSRSEEGDYERAIELFKINCSVANRLNVKRVVLHLWGGPYSDRCFSNNLKAYPALAKIANEHGIELLIENIVCVSGSPMQRMVELYKAYPDIKFIFDTKMAQFHSELELLYDEKYAPIVDRIRHFHINDYNGGYKEWEKFKTLHIGRGCVDFDRFFEFIKKIGYDGYFTVEGTSFNSDGTLDFDSLNKDFEYIGEKLK